MSAAEFDVFDCPLDGTRLIEASAGTGKTWNLCGLYLRLLLQRGLRVHDILVVTFTNAATAELHERIRARIAETLAHLRGAGVHGADSFAFDLLHSLRTAHGLADADMRLHLDLALQTFDEASIFTIHGFCQRALAETPFSTGMPMVLENLNDDSAMRLDVVHDFWRRRIAGDAMSSALAGHLLDLKDTPAKLSALLKRRLAKPLSLQLWPETLAPLLAPAAVQQQATPHALQQALPQAQALQAAFAAARALWQIEREVIVGIVNEARPRLNQNRYSREAVEQAVRSWDEWLARGDGLGTALGATSGTTPGTTPGATLGTSLGTALGKSADLPKLDLLSATRLKPNKAKLPPQPHAFFECAETLLALHAAHEEGLALQRLGLLRELLDGGPLALRRAKREHRVTGFDDMLFNLHDRLSGEHGASLARALRQRFPAALIDEFQDTDPLQFSIVRSIYGGSAAPLFLVGDPKQAIYSFRNADLNTYMQARSEALAEYTLTHNQRSTGELLAALNGLFGANPRAFMLPGLEYRPVSLGAKPRQPLLDRSTAPQAPNTTPHSSSTAPQAASTMPQAAHGAPQTAPAALQLWALPRGADGQPLPRREAIQAALQACAAEIARRLGAARQGLITLGERALAAGDIAVLVRSHAHGAAMRRALARVGVGSVELSQASVFDSPDAAEIERVLAAMLEPTRESLLRAALATELMGRDAVALQAWSDDEALQLHTLTRFAGYHEHWLRRGIGPMLRRWMTDEGVPGRLLARGDGERRMTNLLHLAECLHEASAEQAGPEALLRWLQSQRSAARHDDAAQLRLESERDLVQVVTIHKSKGLEYPLVFCPLLWLRQPSRGHGGDGLEYHDELGDAVIDFRMLDKPQRDALVARLALDSAAESMRLMYVALTRAVHRCWLVVGPYLSRHGKSLSATTSCRAQLNWLVAGAGTAPQDWPANSLRARDIEDAWAALAHRHAPHIGIDVLPHEPAAPLAAQRIGAQRLAARAPPAHITAAWRIGSYSSLTHGARHEGAAVDHDLRATEPVPDPGADAIDSAVGTVVNAAQPAAGAAEAVDGAAGHLAIDADDILNFPRGTVAGECLHALFERIDFGDASGWPAAIDTVLRRYTPALGGAPSTAPWSRQLLRLLHDVMHTPLPTAAPPASPPVRMRLADVPPQHRRVEMEFHLPAAQLDARALGNLLRQQGYAVPALEFGALTGYLRGFIDLVFEHDAHYYILDWKSNHLGERAADYAPAALARAMDAQGYHLQALLYALALHRHLRQRLPQYRYERHFGGALYLFVRGVRPGWTASDGTPVGVHAHRPTLQTLELLSALLDGDRERV